MAEAGGADELRAGPGLRHGDAFLDGNVTVVLVVDHQARHVELACQDFGEKYIVPIGVSVKSGMPQAAPYWSRHIFILGCLVPTTM